MEIRFIEEDFARLVHESTPPHDGFIFIHSYHMKSVVLMFRVCRRLHKENRNNLIDNGILKGKKVTNVI